MVRTRPNVVAIDFDGTLVDLIPYEVGVYGPLKPGASEALKILKQMGWKVIIWTCRNEDEGIAKFLTENDVPFDEINKNSETDGYKNLSVKVVADLYIDDKGLRFTSWGKIIEQVLQANCDHSWCQEQEDPESGTPIYYRCSKCDLERFGFVDDLYSKEGP